MQNLQHLPKDRIGVFWVNPNDAEERQAWDEAWALPALPTWVLLGPDRRIMAVEPSTEEIRAIFSLKSKSTTRSGGLHSLRPSRKNRQQR